MLNKGFFAIKKIIIRVSMQNLKKKYEILEFGSAILQAITPGQKMEHQIKDSFYY